LLRKPKEKWFFYFKFHFQSFEKAVSFFSGFDQTCFGILFVLSSQPKKYIWKTGFQFSKNEKKGFGLLRIGFMVGSKKLKINHLNPIS
jgi:hypothetical protein